MADVENALPLAARRELRIALSKTKDSFVSTIPKVELHIHIEGILTPALKWRFAQRNNMTLTYPRTGVVFSTLEEYGESHDTMKPLKGARMNNSEETLSFFDAYYGGFEVLRTERDYYDLAMHYYEHAAAMNVRYCEIFFDPQGHTRTGTTWETMMAGFREAQEKAEKDMNVRGQECDIGYSDSNILMTGEICLGHVHTQRFISTISDGALSRGARLSPHDHRHRSRLK